MISTIRIVCGLSAAALAATVLAGCSNASRLNLRCVAGDLQRCRQLGDMYASGNGVRQDFGQAAYLYERVCDAGIGEVCNTLGQIYEHVPGFESESGRVEGLYQRACNANSADGCMNLGLIAYDREDYEQAAALFERSCIGGSEGGCHHLAISFENGQGVNKDVQRAVALFEQSCNAQYMESCETLAKLFTEGVVVPKDMVRAIGYYDQIVTIYSDSCDAGNTLDCRERDRFKTRVDMLRAVLASQR
jgi:TPR repeat protein